MFDRASVTRRIIVGLYAAACLALVAQQALSGYLLNAHRYAGPSVTFIGCTTDATDLTAYTYSAQALSTESSARFTIVGITGFDAATVFGVSTVTVNGDSATEVVDQEGAGSLVDSAVYILANPVGTSEDIVVTWSEPVSQSIICVWSAYNLSSATAVASASNFDTASASFSLGLNVSSDGIAVGVCDTNSSPQTHTWTGLTERADAAGAGGENVSYSAADYKDVIGGSSPLAVTCDATGAGDATGAAASWR